MTSMKIYKKLSLAIFFFVGLAVSSCKKWIDVAPKTQIESSRFLSNQQGYVEALGGVYLKMVGTSMYGKELTFGLVDVLGSSYTTNGITAYRTAFSGNYQDQAVLNIVTNIYSNTYNAIANLNNILEQIEKADKSIFSSGQFEIIKGEALGLRAFLHFDMLRLHTKSYKAGGLGSSGIPYVTFYGGQVTPRLTVKDDMDKILIDLNSAEQLLKKDILVTRAYNSSDTSAFNRRKERFNYYAVKATKARAYLWMQDNTNALKEAEEVIAVAPVKFPFVALSSLTVADPDKNKVFTTEHLFGLTAEKLQQNYTAVLDSSLRFTGSLQYLTQARVSQQYEGIITDIRSQYMIKQVVSQYYYSKLHQPQISKRMPLIKIPEMYYIAAECLSTTNPGKAVDYLNVVRRSRGIGTDLSQTSSTADIMIEVEKEYRKEFPNEGQIFFFHKRQNSTSIIGVSGIYPSARYVLPLPQQEIDFGI